MNKKPIPVKEYWRKAIGQCLAGYPPSLANRWYVGFQESNNCSIKFNNKSYTDCRMFALTTQTSHKEPNPEVPSQFRIQKLTFRRILDKLPPDITEGSQSLLPSLCSGPSGLFCLPSLTVLPAPQNIHFSLGCLVVHRGSWWSQQHQPVLKLFWKEHLNHLYKSKNTRYR